MCSARTFFCRETRAYTRVMLCAAFSSHSYEDSGLAVSKTPLSPVELRQTMVVALAVVSRDGTPLYLHDYNQPTASNPPSKEGYYDDEPIMTGVGCDVVPKDSTNLINEWPCKLTFQFILHEAYHFLCKILITNQWKIPTTMMGGGSTDGSAACWVGYLCSSSGFQCYGYVTTNVFYIVIVEDTIAPDDKENQLSRDRELCMLMVYLIVFSLTAFTYFSPFMHHGLWTLIDK